MQALDWLPSNRFRLLKRDEYDQLVEAGCFRDERVELLYGRIVKMPAHGHDHAYAIMRLTEALAPLMGRAYVRVQLPLAASDLSEPEPDLAVVPRRDVKPHPNEALLVVEVAESSLKEDRLTKRPLYANMPAPEYWIVNLVDNVVEVYRDPDLETGTHRSFREFQRGEQIALVAFPDLSIGVNEILPTE